MDNRRLERVTSGVARIAGKAWDMRQWRFVRWIVIALSMSLFLEFVGHHGQLVYKYHFVLVYCTPPILYRSGETFYLMHVKESLYIALNKLENLDSKISQFWKKALTFCKSKAHARASIFGTRALS